VKGPALNQAMAEAITDDRPPLPDASLHLRARWAAQYLTRSFAHEPCTKTNLDLALRWMHEAAKALERAAILEELFLSKCFGSP
jgi:hypothetical protein